MANPKSRAAMTFYPQNLEGKMTETWHADKWVMDADDSVLTPMIRQRGVSFYVDELAACADGSFFIPKQWVWNNEKMQAIGYRVSWGEVSRIISTLNARELI